MTAACKTAVLTINVIIRRRDCREKQQKVIILIFMLLMLTACTAGRKDKDLALNGIDTGAASSAEGGEK